MAMTVVKTMIEAHWIALLSVLVAITQRMIKVPQGFTRVAVAKKEVVICYITIIITTTIIILVELVHKLLGLLLS